jgi:hypothetical protein
MPTKHPRISVTKDEELATALASVESVFGNAGVGTIVHTLAIKGAQALAQEEQTRVRAIERLVAVSTDPAGLLDVEVLKDIDARAWE